MLVIYGTEIPKESVFLFGIKLDEDVKLKVSQKQVKRVIKEMRTGLRFWKFKLLGKIKRCIHVLFRPYYLDLPVLKSISIQRVRWSFIQTCLGNFHRFSQLKWSILIDRVEFYSDLSLDICIDLPVFKSILINRFKFYPDLSLDIS